MDEHPHDPERDPVDEGAPPSREPLDPPASGEEPSAPSRASQPGYGGDPNSIEVYPTLRRGLGAAIHAFPRMALVLLPVYVFAQTVSILGAPDLFLGSTTPGRVPEFSTSDWLVFAGVMVFQFTFGTWAQGALLFVGEASLDGAPLPGFRAAYGRALERVPSLVGTSLLLILALVFGTLFCIAPGVWAAAALMWGILRAGVREEGPLTALRHSYLLTRKRIWRVLGAFFSMLLFVMPLAFVAGIASLVLRMGDHGSPTTAQLAPLILLQVILGVVIAPAIACMQLALHERLETLGPKA
jgi:hypothetical protein